MRSRDIFERPTRAVKPRKPIGLVAVLSLILPGTGHVLLGRTPQGFGLLAVAVLALPASIAARTFLPDFFAPLAWLIGRLGVLAAIFAVVDAPMLAREPRWQPKTPCAIHPRIAAAWNFAFYGLGHLKMDERASGWIAIVFGGAAHIALVLFLPAGATIVAEAIPLLLALWAYRQANEIGSQRHSLGSGDDESGSSSTVRPLAIMPPWVLPTQAFFVTALALSGVLVWVAHAQWLANRSIDRSLAIVQEPFYRNPVYGLQLEMRAPGWSFRQDDPSLFFDAVHIGHKSRLQVRLEPRIPGRDSPGTVQELFQQALRESGLHVLSVTSEAVVNQGLPATRLYATAARGSQGREIAGLAYDHGFRRYLLHMEWDPDHASFGMAEWDFVLNGLTIEDEPFGIAVVAR